MPSWVLAVHRTLAALHGSQALVTGGFAAAEAAWDEDSQLMGWLYGN